MARMRPYSGWTRSRRRRLARLVAAGLAGMALALAPAGLAGAEPEWRFSNEYIFTSNKVSGPGHATSTLSRGGHYQNIFNMGFDSKAGDRSLTFNLGLSITNDRNIDPKTMNLTNLELRYEDPRQSLTLGDTMNSFSPYSMSASLKGANYHYFDKDKNGPDITLVYGIQLARWDNFWDSDALTQSLPRRATGLRVKQTFGEQLTVGINAVRSHDRPRIGGSDTLYNATVFSTDWDYRFSPFWMFNGELSRSASSSWLTGDSNRTHQAGNALRLGTVAEKGKRRFSVDYEKVSPYFMTLMGSAATDKEKIKLDYKDRLGLGSIYHVGYYWDRNNLQDQLATTSQSQTHEVGVTLQQPFGRENASADISFRRNRQYASDASANGIDKTLSFNWRDKYGVIDADVTVERYLADTAGSVRNSNWNYRTTLTTSYTKGKTTISPTLTVGYSKQADEIASSREASTEYSLGVSVSNAETGVTATMQTGWRLANRMADNDDSKWFASVDVRFKPGFLKQMKNSSMFVKLAINDYRYITSTQNYRENSFGTGVKFEW